MGKPTLLLDFDATIHQYDGSFSAHLGPPIERARKAVLLLAEHFNVVYFTSRGDSPDVAKWLAANGFPKGTITAYKRGGLIVDDRCITFNGEWTEELIEQIKSFRPYWKRGVTTDSDC